MAFIDRHTSEISPARFARREQTLAAYRSGTPWLALCAVTALGLSTAAHATLIDRGGGLIYDMDLNLTWLANANAGAGSAFDDGTNTTDGRMSWDNASAWAASLSTGGVSSWRLPNTLDPDAACTDDGSTPSSDIRGFTCTGSEMPHLFYAELGGTVSSSILASTDPDLALFSNIQGQYWSGTSEAGFPDFAWYFVFTEGSQNDAFKTTNFLNAWAVHGGDVGAVPAPGAAWLLGTGLAGLIGRGLRKRAVL